MNFPLTANDNMIFQAADAIWNTKKSLAYHKDSIKAAKDQFSKEYHKSAIQFERDKYFSDLSWFTKLAGHDNWQQYV